MLPLDLTAFLTFFRGGNCEIAPNKQALTHQDENRVCGMWRHGAVWSIHIDCISSLAFYMLDRTTVYRYGIK